jgi:hypothetical protein
VIGRKLREEKMICKERGGGGENKNKKKKENMNNFGEKGEGRYLFTTRATCAFTW